MNVQRCFVPYSTKEEEASVWMCLWVEEGAFMLAKTLWLSLVYLVEVVEALELYHAIKCVIDVKFNNIDSKIVVNAFINNQENVPKFGYVISACKHIFLLGSQSLC